MITTVTFDAMTERKIRISTLAYGTRNKIQSRVESCSGKGGKISRLIALMEQEVRTTGISFEDIVIQANVEMQNAGVQADWIMCSGKAPLQERIVETDRGTEFFLQDVGSTVQSEQMDVLLEKLTLLSQDSDVMLLCGDFSAHYSEKFYKSVIENCAKNCKIVLDGNENTLREGIAQAPPFFIHTNRYEMESLVNVPLPTLAFAKDAASSVQNEGVGMVVVSLGNEGVIVAGDKNVYHAKLLKGLRWKEDLELEHAMLAAFCVALAKHFSEEDTLRYGVAALSTILQDKKEHKLDYMKFQEILPKILIEKL